MGMSDLYGPADDRESVATIQAALDAGITLLDTGDYYGMGHNELLIREALRGRRERAIISVKFGALRDATGAWLGIDARPAAVRNFLAYTLRRLGTDYVDIYRPGRLDPAVPIEETVGAIADAIKAGHVRHVGLSEVGADTLRRAHQTHPIEGGPVVLTVSVGVPVWPRQHADAVVMPQRVRADAGLARELSRTQGLSFHGRKAKPLYRFQGQEKTVGQRRGEDRALLWRGSTGSGLASSICHDSLEPTP